VLLFLFLGIISASIPTGEKRGRKKKRFEQKKRDVEAEKKEEKDDEWHKNFWKEMASKSRLGLG
jgi:hypothetical protein